MDVTAGRPLSLAVRDERLAIARLEPTTDWPAWALACRFVALTRTEQELSIVCPEGVVPTEVRAERGWRAFHVAGPIDFNLIGVLAGLTTALASNGIAVFAISTFDTDLILVREASLRAAVDALIGAGYEVRDAK